MDNETRRRDCAALGEMRADLLALHFTTDAVEELVQTWWESRLRMVEMVAEQETA